MIKANKNLSHDNVDYVKGQVIKDEDVAAKLLKMGHAEAGDEVQAPAKKKAVKGEVKVEPQGVAPVESDEGEESFDDIADEDDLPPAAEVVPKAKAPAKKKAASKKK